MARKGSPTILQEELYPLPGERSREEIDDARMLDLDADQESPFLRGQKRVSARRGPLPKKTASVLMWLAFSLGVLFLGGVVGSMLYHYGEHSWRFRVQSSDNIEISGLHNVTRGQVMDVMGGDIGRNIFFVPLAERKTQLEQVPWVESASVMRFVPNRLQVEIHERTPVAFARVSSKVLLVDAGGTLMDLPGAGKKKYSFPVILGMNPGEPLSTRAPRMRIYNEVIRQLDSGGAHYSQDLSEVDITDPDDVKVLASNPQGEVLLHLGSENYLDRYKIYVAHAQEWRQQFDKLESVDLRYDRQIIVNPDMPGAKPVLTAKATVKPASLITHIAPSPRPLMGPQKASTSGPPAKPAKKKQVAKAHRRRAIPKKTASQKLPAASGHAPATAQAPNQKLAPTTKVTAPPVTSTAPVKISETNKSKKPSPAILKGQETNR